MTDSQNPLHASTAKSGVTEGRYADDAGANGPRRYEKTETFTGDPSSSAAVGEAVELKGSAQVEATVPATIGKFIVERQLGAGGFGQVFLANDAELQRRVAVKVPHKHHVASPEAIAEFLAEARTLAKLEHHGIVTVYDFGRFDDRCFIVTKYIEGETLRQRQRRLPLTMRESVELLYQIAQTLAFIHSQRVVHRDIKPGNILLDRSGNCYLADFGLALREENFGSGPGYLGTVGYMSPEQVRGEGHLVDGRSDLFSLGVVMYELLTGALPFEAPDRPTVLKLIAFHEPRPLRQRQPDLPKELERICMRLLSKRASDRHLVAQDLADDLKCFLSQTVGTDTTAPTITSRNTQSQSTQGQRFQVGIVPRGLRSFDQEDSIFFRDLLPGPRDRDGLPDSLRFWARRIDTTDPEELFRLGVIYGPSGSGKSSFVKAGLLPLLQPSLTALFIEASASDTEQRLLEGLRVRVPDLPTDLNLSDSLAWLRRSVGTSSRRKVLLVIDQFEQWLHACGDDPEATLPIALRQCDGLSVQCLLLVRDDFWLAISRLAERVEVDLIRRRNLAMVDLFDKQHGKRVLTEYGRAYGRLPPHTAAFSKGQETFLSQAIEGLAEGGKLIPVQLATFAEIMKDREWDAKSLHELGGTRGVGVWFMEDSFSSSNAPAQYREHEAAVQAVLKSLLPNADANIKGAMRSEAELLTASGYADRPRQFAELLRILDTELKLITPTEHRSQPDRAGQSARAERFYQLTHDFLVPAVREWLGRRQQQTFHGRAALRLAARTEVWQSRPENRHLPSWLEWLNYLIFTRANRRSPQEQRLMTLSTRRHGLATLVTILCLSGIAWLSAEIWSRNRAAALVEQLGTSQTSQVTGILEQLERYGSRCWAPAQELSQQAEINTPAGLHARLALLRHVPADEALLQQLSEHVLTSDLEAVSLISSELFRHPGHDKLAKHLWDVLESNDSADDAKNEQRFRAGLVLAGWMPPTEPSLQTRWDNVGSFLAEQMLAHCSHPGHYDMLVRLLQPVRSAVLPKLREECRNSKAPPKSLLATLLTIDLLRDAPEQLADAYLDADDSQISKFLDPLDKVADKITPFLQQTVLKYATDQSSPELQQRTANQQINAAVFLIRHGRPVDLEDLFRHRPISSTRAGLIERVVNYGRDVAGPLRQLLDQTDDPGAVSGALLALGSMPVERQSKTQRADWGQLARTLYVTHPAADVHAAAEWLLRQQGEKEWIVAATANLSKQTPPTGSQWQVNSQSQTLVKVKLPDHTMEMANMEVSVEQFRRFRTDYYHDETRAPDVCCPAISVDWFAAVDYCRWLTEQEGLGEAEQCFPPPTADRTTATVKLHPDYKLRRGYRLPTAAEWEAAYLGQAITEFPFGYKADLVYKYGHLTQDRVGEFYSLGVRGTFKPDAQGLFDLIGNVGEWCGDLDPVNPTDPNIRGSTATSSPESTNRQSSRGSFPATIRFYSIGFRIVRTVPTVD